MRLKPLAGLCLAGMLSTAALAAPPTPVTSVVLYPGGATVVRTAQVAPGVSQVVVAGLPARFDSQTLRAEAGPGIHIGDIVTLDAARTEAVNPAEAELESKIQALEDQQAAVEGDIKAVEIVKAYLERLGDSGSSDRPNAGPDARSLPGVIDTVARSAGEAMAKLQKLNIQKREIGKKAEALRRDLARLRTGTKDSRTVLVNVSADRAGTVKLSYQVPNAGWKPAYRALLDSSTGKVELERMATVSQKTGEDWSNVKLVLSTAQPRQSPTGPEPQPWLLSYYPPQPQAEKMAMPAPLMARSVAAPAGGKYQAEDQPYQPPTFITQGNFSTEFEAPARVTLPSDGREVSVPLAKQTLPVKQYLQIAPRLDKSAVVTAEAQRPEGVWPAGNLQLFRDGNYVGASQWNPQKSDRFVLSFGRDELLRVAVDEVEGKSGTKGIFGGRQERRMADVFTLTSAHRKPVDVVVLESSPVATSEEIRVQATFDPKPTTTTWEQKRGVVAWQKTLGPNETAKFTVDYAIDYPKEGNVSGLR
ncbi:MAG TPA: mucoidy inhibitor MuiA family protein [Rhodocyclaceae bacterium]|nr:mucoidy inhibitor MuiA family protein [Rhodocyclaceae bacterium]